MRVRRGVVTRLLHVDGAPVVVRAWQRRDGQSCCASTRRERRAGASAVEVAIERMRFALGVDDDYRPTSTTAFGRDPLLGPAIRRRPWMRPRRRPWPWEALAWAVTEQLIESSRAARSSAASSAAGGRGQPGPDGGGARDVPDARAAIAGRAPAELAAMDLAPERALALVRVAREVASGRADLAYPDGDRRLLAIREIGPWTVQCLGLYGRGEPDSLPAGDLAYVKLVGRLAGLGRRATVGEVEEFFAPYAPFRGLAGTFALAGYHNLVAQGPPLRLAA